MSGLTVYGTLMSVLQLISHYHVQYRPYNLILHGGEFK